MSTVLRGPGPGRPGRRALPAAGHAPRPPETQREGDRRRNAYRRPKRALLTYTRGEAPQNEEESGLMQEKTPSQAEGERPDDETAQAAEHRPADPGRTTPSQAEGDREPEDDHDDA